MAQVFECNSEENAFKVLYNFLFKTHLYIVSVEK